MVVCHHKYLGGKQAWGQPLWRAQEVSWNPNLYLTSINIQPFLFSLIFFSYQVCLLLPTGLIKMSEMDLYRSAPHGYYHERSLKHITILMSDSRFGVRTRTLCWFSQPLHSSRLTGRTEGNICLSATLVFNANAGDGGGGGIWLILTIFSLGPM